MPRVLLVDDHAGFRAFARGLIAAGFVIVAELGDGSVALSAAALHHPELVVLDIRLPDMSGLDVARRLKAGPDARVVILIPTGETVCRWLLSCYGGLPGPARRNARTASTRR